MTLFCWLASIQGIYYLLTGVWPLVDIDSFMIVTGPKHDIWLVRTVGALVIPIGLVLLIAAIRKEPFIQTVVLGAASAAAFTAIDTVYAFNDVIRDIYLADAGAQVIFIAGWLVFVFIHRNKLNKRKGYV